jgi:hypothetical protein
MLRLLSYLTLAFSLEAIGPYNRFRQVDQLFIASTTTRRKGDPGAAPADGFIVDPDTADGHLRHDVTNFCAATGSLSATRR